MPRTQPSQSDTHRAGAAKRPWLTWEIVVGILVTAVAAGLSHHYDLFDWFVIVSRGHESYDLDEVFVLFVIGSFMLAIFAVRRSRALTAEMADRRASEARFAGLFAASPDPIGLFSLDDGTVLDANDTALRAAGLRQKDVVGRPMRELPYWDAATADELLRRVREEGLVRNMEVMTRGDSGQQRPVLVSAQAFDLDGRQCFVASMSDVTEQRAAERARDAADAELASVFSAMRDIVMVLGRDGEYLKIPATNADRLYRPAADLVGKRVHDVLPHAEADGMCAVIRQSLDDRSAVMMEYMLRLDDRNVWFSAVVTPLDADRVVWVARDITDELQAQHSLRESEAQYKLLFDRNPQPMFVVDEVDFGYRAVNEAAVHHYGYSREEFLAMTAADLRPLDEITVNQAYAFTDWPVYARRLFRHRKRNGDVIDVEITRDSILYQGRPSRLILATDVTERLQVSGELKRSLSLQRATLEAAADGILVVDRLGGITSWNGKFAELWDLPATIVDVEEVEGAFVRALAGMKAVATATPLENAVAPSPQITVFDRLELADGRTIERYSQPQLFADEIVGRVWSFRDVTQRERENAQRKVLTDRFESAFGDAPIGMTIISPDGRLLQVNTAMCELLGRSPDEMLGKTSEFVTHASDRDQTRSVLERLRSGKERTVRMEKRYLHSSGRVVWTLINATMLGGEKNSAFVILQILDITEQRAAEESLRRQALAFETMSEVVIVCEPDGRIIDVNPAAKAVFGYERDEVIGKKPQLWMREDQAFEMFQTIGEALRTVGGWSGEYGFVAKDGRTGIVESTIKSLRDADGNTVNVIGVIRDVSERNQMERQLLQAQKLEAIGSLAAGIAHEINTPTQYVGDNVRFLGDSIGALGSVVLEARALANAARTHAGLADAVAVFDRATFEIDVDYLITELPLAADNASEGCERIADIVKAMKGFSHPGGLRKQFVDLNAAVRDAVTVCRSEWKYVATLAMDFDATMPLVPCLPGELQQVVLNLVVNAAHAVVQAQGDSGHLGAITVSTRHDADWAEIRVQDDGCGIPESIRGKVFDPFFTTKKVGSGSGQGLSISHATVVRKHQGTLTFESAEGAGTTFILRLPLSSRDEISEAA